MATGVIVWDTMQIASQVKYMCLLTAKRHFFTRNFTTGHVFGDEYLYKNGANSSGTIGHQFWWPLLWNLEGSSGSNAGKIPDKFMQYWNKLVWWKDPSAPSSHYINGQKKTSEHNLIRTIFDRVWKGHEMCYFLWFSMNPSSLWQVITLMEQKILIFGKYKSWQPKYY